MKKLIPVILMVLGLVGGGAAGIMLQKPATPAECPPDDEHCEAVAPEADHAGEPEAGDHGETADAGEDAGGDHGDEAVASIEYFALQRQMIVPIVDQDRVVSLMVLSLSLEVSAGNTTVVYDREPKLRDAFLQVLFRHANTGGFDGAFTTGEKMSDLRHALDGAAHEVLGDIVHQVLVTEILRQDV